MPRRKTRFQMPYVVPHPKYGDAPMISGQDLGVADLCQSYWRYAHSSVIAADMTSAGKLNATPGPFDTEYIFLGSAIAADTKKQNFSVFPRHHYVDTLKKCRACPEWFIFFALEQRHWYESLGFWIDADCVLCPLCRLSDQRLRRAKNRYAQRVVEPSALTDREFATLLRDALFLAESGVLKGRPKLRRLRNMAIRRGISGEPLSAVSNFLEDSPVAARK